MSNPADRRKVLIGTILAVLWMCTFVFLPGTLLIDWNDDFKNLTPLRPITALVGLLVIVFYHIFYKASSEATKLSLTVTLTITWLTLMFFYPFKTDINGGAVGFFALLGGLAVVVLWVRFFSDEVIV